MFKSIIKALRLATCKLSSSVVIPILIYIIFITFMWLFFREEYNDRYLKPHELYNLLEKSERPVLILGNGINLSNSRDELNKFIQKYKIPCVVSILGTDLITTENYPYASDEAVGKTIPIVYGEHYKSSNYEYSSLSIIFSGFISKIFYYNAQNEYEKILKKIESDQHSKI